MSLTDLDCMRAAGHDEGSRSSGRGYLLVALPAAFSSCRFFSARLFALTCCIHSVEDTDQVVEPHNHPRLSYAINLIPDVGTKHGCPLRRYVSIRYTKSQLGVLKDQIRTVRASWSWTRRQMSLRWETEQVKGPTGVNCFLNKFDSRSVFAPGLSAAFHLRHRLINAIASSVRCGCVNLAS